ncbi:hypothetical protein H4582DRAFT_1038897 [Lactarius indigo]|nr:hypothetical protein H4582DRAFT_1038897 [Lactarius indigo]
MLPPFVEFEPEIFLPRWSMERRTVLYRDPKFFPFLRSTWGLRPPPPTSALRHAVPPSLGTWHVLPPRVNKTKHFISHAIDAIEGMYGPVASRWRAPSSEPVRLTFPRQIFYTVSLVFHCKSSVLSHYPSEYVPGIIPLVGDGWDSNYRLGISDHTRTIAMRAAVCLSVLSICLPCCLLFLARTCVTGGVRRGRFPLCPRPGVESY